MADARDPYGDDDASPEDDAADQGGGGGGGSTPAAGEDQSVGSLGAMSAPEE
ncbi:MAG: hypothetical protein ACRDIV_13235 [Ktedonobacteraceae bacterium]